MKENFSFTSIKKKKKIYIYNKFYLNLLINYKDILVIYLWIWIYKKVSRQYRVIKYSKH